MARENRSDGYNGMANWNDSATIFTKRIRNQTSDAMKFGPVAFLLFHNQQQSYANALALSLVLLNSHNFKYFSVSALTS